MWYGALTRIFFSLESFCAVQRGLDYEVDLLGITRGERKEEAIFRRRGIRIKGKAITL